MKFLALLGLLPLALAAGPVAPVTPQEATGDLGDAAVIEGNPTNVTYHAVFEGEGITGEIVFHAGKGGKGVHAVVNLKGFPAGQGPYGYHVHDQPVPANGSCLATKAHLDPYIRGQNVSCDATRPESCEVGDLSGKHGAIPNNSNNSSAPFLFGTEFEDAYLSLKSPSGAFIGNRSVVIHASKAFNSTRIACANIELKTDGDHGDGNGDGHGNGGTHTPTPTPSPDSGAARLTTGAFAAVFVAFGALLL